MRPPGAEEQVVVRPSFGRAQVDGSSTGFSRTTDSCEIISLVGIPLCLDELTDMCEITARHFTDVRRS